MSTPRKHHPSPPDAAVLIQPSSPRYAPPPGTPTAGAQRKIGIAVDLSDESAYAVRWAVQNYLRPGDAVVLVHVSPTSVLYGADWGSIDLALHDEAAAVAVDAAEDAQKRRLEDEFDAFTTAKANDLAQPLVDAQLPFKIHIVKDHDMKERLCLEVERLGLSAVVIGSRGFGAARKNAKGRLGSVSDYCVHHCVCPVIVVRFPCDKDKNGGGSNKLGSPAARSSRCVASPAVPEEEPEYHDACDKHSEMDKAA
ncbi:universal stress protein PHOS34 isoform X2 [Syzygium oleosum]|uniref:universal stress protein PHOS34 isoform X2 n=1 Tax=Syzygium oleosum TaxID=219896 RepID=UPI0011D20CE8|nr:universal stress protein PHOS34 isoform X2 [Syzygium oleosum]